MESCAKAATSVCVDRETRWLCTQAHRANSEARKDRERERERGRKTRCGSCVQSCAFTADKTTNGLYVQDKALSASQKSAYLYFTNHTTRQALPHKNAFVVKPKNYSSLSLSSPLKKIDFVQRRKAQIKTECKNRDITACTCDRKHERNMRLHSSSFS